MQKVYSKILVTLSLVLLLSNICYSQVNSQISSNSQISATIVITFSAKQISILDFGTFLPTSSESKIKVTPEGRRLIDGSISATNSSYSSAGYYLSGEDAAYCSMILPDSATTLTNPVNSKTIIISDWEVDTDSDQSSEEYDVDWQEIKLGATLIVGNKVENPVGIYSGTYEITFMNN